MLLILSMMKKGYAAIIIQGSAGSGKAVEYNKKILKKNTLLASIKMPIDLFVGKSSVQTYVYVFKIGEAHEKDETVKFIDGIYLDCLVDTIDRAVEKCDNYEQRVNDFLRETQIS